MSLRKSEVLFNVFVVFVLAVGGVSLAWGLRILVDEFIGAQFDLAAKIEWVSEREFDPREFDPRSAQDEARAELWFAQRQGGGEGRARAQQEEEEAYQALREDFFLQYPKLRSPGYCRLSSRPQGYYSFWDFNPKKDEEFAQSMLSHGEQCWDGNKVSGDGCSPVCRWEYCGNRIIDPGEQCDDGNNADGDGCSPMCTVELCGNGILDPGEECDGEYYCTTSCTREMFPYVLHTLVVQFLYAAHIYLETCGNGIFDPGEECDPPNRAGCNSACQVRI